MKITYSLKDKSEIKREIIQDCDNKVNEIYVVDLMRFWINEMLKEVS